MNEPPVTDQEELQARIAAGLRRAPNDEPAPSATADDVPETVREARVVRKGTNYQGLSTHDHLRALFAGDVDQAYLEEIGYLVPLEELQINVSSASDFSVLSRLENLKILRLLDVREMDSLDWLTGLPTLESLELYRFGKRFTRLDGIEGAPRLRALGVDAGNGPERRIASLAPLASLKHLEVLSLVNTRVDDQSLEPLHHVRSLRYLFTTNFFGRTARAKFEALHAANPALRCMWFESSVWKLLGGK